ncbi:MAG: hypothetical protein ACRDK4_07995 [Solirubrobacteraceae bacterium]
MRHSPKAVFLLVAAVGIVGSMWTVVARAAVVGRGYEMVSPQFKGGYGASGIEAVSPDGERLAYGSRGAFAGDPANEPLDNVYLASRMQGVGWSTVALTPPAALAPTADVFEYSPSLLETLSMSRPGPNYSFGSDDTLEQAVLLHDDQQPDAAPLATPEIFEPAPYFELAGALLRSVNGKRSEARYLGASADMSHIVLSEIQEAPLLTKAAKTQSTLYELISHPAPGEEPLVLVGLNNKGGVLDPACPTGLGSVGLASEKGSRLGTVAAGGSIVLFATGVGGECRQQLFARLGRTRTIELSRPLEPCGSGSKVGEVPCAGAEERAPAEFQGASDDSSTVFFKTSQRLVAGDTDEGPDLYMARIGCPAVTPGCGAAEMEVTELVQVTHDTNPSEPSDFQDVVTPAPDGSRVYFVARGVLHSGVNAQGRAPVAGAENLYVYDTRTAAAPVFIADLCSGPETSGTVEDIECPGGLTPADGSGVGRNDEGLWAKNDPQAQVNVCARPAGECTGTRETGRFLLFSSYGQLTEDDTDTARDVYHYDALTGSLQRVSVGEDGADSDGNGEGAGSDASIAATSESGEEFRQHGLDSRSISEDGSRAVFASAEPLALSPTDGLLNAYEWDEGRVGLISTGSSSAPIENLVMSASGRNIFFATTQGLVPQDSDGQYDIYDARLGGGFPRPPEPARECSGDSCYGPLSEPAPLLVPGSVAQAPGDEFRPAKPIEKAKVKKTKRASKRKAHGRRSGRSSRRGSRR